MKFANTFGMVFKHLSSVIMRVVNEEQKLKWERQETKEVKVWMKVPAPAVIPAPRAYINTAVVKTPVVNLRVFTG